MAWMAGRWRTDVSGVPGHFLGKLDAGGQSQLGLDVREVRLHGA
ncbi:MAG TPA: hypothetical protein VGC05_14680 [Mycobacterium sp.]